MAIRLLYALRHGETDWNVAQRWQGHTDVPLNDNGRAQAKRVAVALRARALGAIVASDLSRAAETASIVAAEVGVTVSYLDPALRERGFGCFEGLTRGECEREHPEVWRAWLADRRAPPGGESHEALTERALAAVERAANHLTERGAAGLLVTHGGTLRAIAASVNGSLPPPVENVELWELRWDGRLLSAARV
jgi:probable phosphoglycerate mutase